MAVQERAQLADSPTRAPLSARQVAPAQVDSAVKISFITVHSGASITSKTYCISQLRASAHTQPPCRNPPCAGAPQSRSPSHWANASAERTAPPRPPLPSHAYALTALPWLARPRSPMELMHTPGIIIPGVRRARVARSPTVVISAGSMLRPSPTLSFLKPSSLGEDGDPG